MKKILIVALVAAASVVMTGCQKEEQNPVAAAAEAVKADADKAAWASAVRNQELPWVNVCDTRGVQSPYIASYGIGSLPMAWFIVDGTIDLNAKVHDAASLRDYIRRQL